MSETKEQIAERVAAAIDDLPGDHFRAAAVDLILAALREVQAAAHCLRSTSQIISAEQRAEKAETEVQGIHATIRR